MHSAETVIGGIPDDPGAAVEPGDPSSEGSPETQVTLTVAAVAARLGVAPSTLRTWDRRYGLGPSGRAAGSHRRYTADDIARLETMRRLTLAGAAPSDAARVAANSAPALVTADLPAAATATAAVAARPVFVDALTLAAAAAKGEESRVRRMYEWVVRERGIVGAWTEIAEPALGYLASRDPADKPGRDPENILAGAVLAGAQSGPDAAVTRPTGSPGVLLYADPRDLVQHLGAHVLAAALVERGIVARVVRATGDPDRVRLASQSAPIGVLALVGAPPGAEERAREAAERSDQVVFMVGPRAPAVWLPGVHRVRTFEGALHEIAGALAERPEPAEPAEEGAPGQAS